MSFDPHAGMDDAASAECMPPFNEPSGEQPPDGHGLRQLAGDERVVGALVCQLQPGRDTNGAQHHVRLVAAREAARLVFRFTKRN